MTINKTIKGDVVGWIKLTDLKHNGQTEVEYLFVKKDFRGNGIATSLIKDAMNIKHSLICFIEPHPESDLTYEKECEWLSGLGFKYLNKYDFGDCKKPVMAWFRQFGTS